ncbi:MAG: cytochrome b/b6 domain-containing protein [Betaproteobacteria bacterium]
MNSTNPATGFAANANAATGPTRRVVDAATRMFHWLFALCFTLAYATADGERWRLVHVTLGYTLAGLLVFRLGYGLLGPRQARLSLLWRKLAGLPAWLRSLQPGGTPGVNWRQGQNLLMALAIGALMAVVLPVAISGYATYNDWGGEWLEELHAFTGELFLWLVLGHLALILGLSLLRRKNQALPMLTGRVQGSGPDLAQHNHGALAALLLVAVLGFWAWQWQHAPDSLPARNTSHAKHAGSLTHDNH